MLERRAAGSRRQSEMIGQSEGRSRGRVGLLKSGPHHGTELSVRHSTSVRTALHPKPETHITVLNLSSNNIRGLPPEISNLTQLRAPRPQPQRTSLRSSQGLHQPAKGDGDDGRAARAPAVRVQPDAHPPGRLVHRRLGEETRHQPEQSRRHPSDIMKLERLVHLNATQTGIKTLPERDRLLRRSGEPSAVREPQSTRCRTACGELNRLHTLHINYRVFASGVDAENRWHAAEAATHLEHIPSVVFHIPQLLEMDLEACKVNAFAQESDQVSWGTGPVLRDRQKSHPGTTSSPQNKVTLEQLTVTESLVELNIAANYFPAFPEAVCSLRQLTLLDVSRNGFKTLPPALKDLRSLRVLLARHNQLTFVDSLADLTELERIDLGFNCIAKLPDNIGQLTKLNRPPAAWQPLGCVAEVAVAAWVISFKLWTSLGTGLIQFPPENGWPGRAGPSAPARLFKRGLWLHNNPIDKPPAKVWNTWESRQDLGHMERMAIQNAPKLSAPASWCFLGDLGSGKTPWPRLLRLGHAAPTKSDAVRADPRFQLSSWRSENGCPFSCCWRPAVTRLTRLCWRSCWTEGASLRCLRHREYQQLGFDVVSRWLRPAGRPPARSSVCN
uniref:PPM-type phosphatase domain-containing protein n=1 Tax=Macrostomum lignano TaxID=282301 RepID=A0A1I8JQT5_9PLAT